MLKKILSGLLVMALIGGAIFYIMQRKNISQPDKVSENVAQNQDIAIEDMVFEYKKGKLKTDCKQDSKMLCAVDFAVKCTINPEFEGCKESKLPKFIFMSDESLKRPTEISYKLHKMKPIAADLIEVHTDSTCNGNWFGLCQGRVIYVLVPDNDSWRVKDIYAIEDRNV
ncbi:MAG: hypothetical protein E7016_05915 [Alphaproteobacteria bacterium]|nr:hypothetical protein [Alphaproteobacteria bacterium]